MSLINPLAALLWLGGGAADNRGNRLE